MMRGHDDGRETDLDAALEALARPAAPAGHLEQVLAATGPAAATLVRPGVGHAFLRPRWALPTAATVLLTAGLAWQMRGAEGLSLPQEPEGPAQGRWGTPPDIDRPVLPPEMYWAMDPFAEFASLRPLSGARRRPSTGASLAAPSFAGDVPVAAERPMLAPPDDEHALPARPADLPEITLATIMPAPLLVAPLPNPPAIDMPAIALAPITLAPIEIDTISAEENP